MKLCLFKELILRVFNALYVYGDKYFLENILTKIERTRFCVDKPKVWGPRGNEVDNTV